MMEESYAVAHFGKPLADITLDDLNHYFSIEHEETDTIEFKSYYEKNQNNHAHKEAGALKTICAFLNSSGGLLVWGAPVGHTPTGRQTKIFTGQLSPVEVLIEKDTFISKLATRVIPLSNLVKMHRVEVELGKYVYLFDVAPSIQKPHQFDNRYWVRLDGQTGVAPHYLIDALFKQVSYPNLGGYIKFIGCRIRQNSLEIRLQVFVLNHSKAHNEQDVYFWITTTKGSFLQDQGTAIYDLEDRQVRREDFASIVSYSHAPFHTLTLSVPIREFQVEPEKRAIELILNFGGRTSPMKLSDYELMINTLGPVSNQQQAKIEELFTVKKELNKSMDSHGLSEEERVRRFIEE